MKKLKTQKEADYLLHVINWEDAFIRESYMVSPSYLKQDGEMVAPKRLPGMFLLIALPHEEHRGIEFFFESVQKFSVTNLQKLQPSISKTRVGVTFAFSGDTTSAGRVQAHKLYYKVINRRYKGWPSKYGYQQAFDRDGELLIPVN